MYTDVGLNFIIFFFAIWIIIGLGSILLIMSDLKLVKRFKEFLRKHSSEQGHRQSH